MAISMPDDIENCKCGCHGKYKTEEGKIKTIIPKGDPKQPSTESTDNNDEVITIIKYILSRLC